MANVARQCQQAAVALMSCSINDEVISQLFLPAEEALQFHPSHSLL